MMVSIIAEMIVTSKQLALIKVRLASGISKRDLYIRYSFAGLSPQDPTWWMTHTPRYYFPKMSSYGDFGATSFVLLVATLGMYKTQFSCFKKERDDKMSILKV